MEWNAVAVVIVVSRRCCHVMSSIASIKTISSDRENEWKMESVAKSDVKPKGAMQRVAGKKRGGPLDSLVVNLDFQQRRRRRKTGSSREHFCFAMLKIGLKCKRLQRRCNSWDSSVSGGND